MPSTKKPAGCGPLASESKAVRSAAAIQRREHGLELVAVRGDRRLYQLVLGLEVVIHIPDRNAGRQCDVGERRPLDPLFVQHLTGGGHEPLALARGCSGNG